MKKKQTGIIDDTGFEGGEPAPIPEPEPVKEELVDHVFTFASVADGVRLFLANYAYQWGFRYGDGKYPRSFHITGKPGAELPPVIAGIDHEVRGHD